MLSKIGKVRDTTNYIKPVILGITESKLDSSVTNTEVNINGYNIFRNDRNSQCFNTKNISSNFIEHVYFEILIPKGKSIAIGIFDRPPNVNDFFKYISKRFPANWQQN